MSVCVSGREKKEGRKREIKNFILLKNLQNRTKKKVQKCFVNFVVFFFEKINKAKKSRESERDCNYCFLLPSLNTFKKLQR